MIQKVLVLLAEKKFRNPLFVQWKTGLSPGPNTIPKNGFEYLKFFIVFNLSWSLYMHYIIITLKTNFITMRLFFWSLYTIDHYIQNDQINIQFSFYFHIAYKNIKRVQVLYKIRYTKQQFKIIDDENYFLNIFFQIKKRHFCLKCSV